MIPVFDTTIRENTYNTTNYYDKTYRVTNDGERIIDYVKERNSLQQTINFILNTERYKFPIYSWDYGVELYKLIGQPMDDVIRVLPGRVTEALIQDNRVTDVTDFEFEVNKKKLTMSCIVHSIYGDIPAQVEVNL